MSESLSAPTHTHIHTYTFIEVDKAYKDYPEFNTYTHCYPI